MTAKLYKAAEVCDLAQLQPYVLRSWEKEFPGIGVQKSADAARLYRQSDVEQVLRIKQLVFGEGLTLSGARRRIEESAPAVPPEAVETPEAPPSSPVAEDVGDQARARIAVVRDGLQSLLTLLSAQPASASVAREDYRLEPPVAPANRGVARSAVVTKSAAEPKRKRATA